MYRNAHKSLRKSLGNFRTTHTSVPSAIMVFKNPEGSSYIEVRNAKGEIIALGGVLRKDVKIAAGVDMTLILALTAEWELNRTWLSTGGGMR